MIIKNFFLALILLTGLIAFSQSTCSEAIYLQQEWQTSTIEIDGEIGPDYGCLNLVRGPQWFYFQIASDGDLLMNIYNNIYSDVNGDVDFILWGPFPDMTCDYNDLSTENVVDCSYSSSLEESPEIGPGSSQGPTTAYADEVYILLVTNFSNLIYPYTIDVSGTGSIFNHRPSCDYSSFEVDSINSNICENSSNGYVSVNIQGDYGPYNYLWSTGQEEATIENLSAGLYQLTVTDERDSSCVFYYIINSIEPVEIEANVEFESESCILPSGYINITLEDSLGNDASYFGINWLDPDLDDTPFVLNLMADVYQYEMLDPVGCVLLRDSVVFEPELLSDYVIVEYLSKHCIEASGYIQVSFDSSITEDLNIDFSIDWLDDTLPDEFYLSNLLPGVYKFVISDGIGCQSDTFEVNFYADTLDNYIYSFSNCTSCISPTGSIRVDVNTSQMNSDDRYFSIDWIQDALEDTTCLNDVPIGDYSYYMTDNWGCKSDTFSVHFYPNSYEIESELRLLKGSRCDENTGELQMQLGEGLMAEDYSWQNGPFTNFSSISSVGLGNYNCRFLDQNECLHSYNVDVTEYWGGYEYLFDITGSQCLENTGSIKVVTNYNDNDGDVRYPINFQWSNGEDNLRNDNTYFMGTTDLNHGEIYVTVTEGSGCQNIDTILVPSIDNLPENLQVTFLHEDRLVIIDDSTMYKYFSNFRWESLTGGHFKDSLVFPFEYDYTQEELLQDSASFILTASDSCGFSKKYYFTSHSFIHLPYVKVRVDGDDSIENNTKVLLFNLDYPKNGTELKELGNGYYGNFVEEGEYIISSIRTDHDLKILNYYSGYKLFWTESSRYYLGRNTKTHKTIYQDQSKWSNTQNKQMFVKGKIKALDEFRNPRVLLEKDNIIKMTYPDVNGDFIFENLESGLFNVYVDKPGYYRFEDKSFRLFNNENRNDINFEVIGDTIYSKYNKNLKKVECFPNPTTDYITIETNNPINSIEVLNINGASIYKKEYTLMLDCYGEKIDVKNWQKGVYLLKIETKLDLIIKKIIVN